ncbi:integrase [Synergistales bacterium]|nr:integrase [Synergistales bacterium]
MPRICFSDSFLSSLEANPDGGVWYSDERCRGLRLYVGSSGKKTWYVHYRQNAKKLAHYKIGGLDLFGVAQAREAARAFLAAVARGETPYLKPEYTEKITLREFISGDYAPWVIEHRRSGKATVALIESSFEPLLAKPIEEITVSAVEQWRTNKRREKASKASTLNRQITALRAALNWGVKRGVIETNPMSHLERLPEDDSDRKVRYLTEEERERLRGALDNAPGYLKVMVVLSLNTGVRRGSLFALEWRDVDFDNRVLTLRASSSKSGKGYFVPLNDAAAEVLSGWRGGATDGLVFPSPVSGTVLNSVKQSWATLLKDAGIEKFRWHDMRHDFASRLVMRGVDLNTVRELLGHSDLKMTLRYAHLAPQVKRSAVDLLR